MFSVAYRNFSGGGGNYHKGGIYIIVRKAWENFLPFYIKEPWVGGELKLAGTSS